MGRGVRGTGIIEKYAGLGVMCVWGKGEIRREVGKKIKIESGNH